MILEARKNRRPSRRPVVLDLPPDHSRDWVQKSEGKRHKTTSGYRTGRWFRLQESKRR